MFTGNTLSEKFIESEIIGARSNNITNTVDFEDGGKDISDTSEGLTYQVWTALIKNDKDVYFYSENKQAFLVYSGVKVTEISFTFDQNMRPVLAFVDDGLPYLRWYDSLLSMQVITALDKDVVNPRVILDDKRISQRTTSDIILGYIRLNSLYFRMQRDRFGVEYLLKDNVNGLNKIGMGRNYRLHFMVPGY